MNNEQPVQSTQIYELFSDCLRVFRKRISILCRLSVQTSQQTQKQLESNLKQCISEGKILMSKFLIWEESKQKNALVFSRFLLRVKQSILSFSSKTAAVDVIDFLKLLESFIKDCNFSTDVSFILKSILLEVPQTKRFTSLNKQIMQLVQFNKQQKNLKSNSINTKTQANFLLFDKFLEALEIQYKIYSSLSIDQGEYRRSFFQALEDSQRNDNTLMQQMLERNRYVKQSILLYAKNYQLQKQRASDKRSKISKTQQKLNRLDAMSTRIRSTSLLDEDQIKSLTFEDKNSIDIKIVAKRDHPTQKSVSLSDTVKNAQIRKLLSIKERTKTYSLNTESSFQLINSNANKIISEFSGQKIMRDTNFLHLKKIQFKGSKIQLGPEDPSQKKISILEQSKKKNFYKRTQQHFKSKLNYIKSIKTEPHKAKPSPKNSLLESIRIQFSHNWAQ